MKVFLGQYPKGSEIWSHPFYFPFLSASPRRVACLFKAWLCALASASLLAWTSRPMKARKLRLHPQAPFIHAIPGNQIIQRTLICRLACSFEYQVSKFMLLLIVLGYLAVEPCGTHLA
jgi:hypothetical protein